MKKAVSLLISLVILLSAFTAIPVHAEGETHKVIIHSAQGLFEDAYADFSSGDIFNVGVNLKSDCQLSQGQFVVKYDPDVFIVSQNFTTDFNFPDPVVNMQNGEFTMVFDSVNQLVNTLSGGNFITFKVKALSTFTSDQTFTFDFQLLEGGRYKTDTDSFGDPRTYIDPSFAKLYIEKSQVKLPGLKVAPHFNEEESVENDEPGTMTATLSNTGYSFGNENWYAYTWTDDGSKWRWVQLGDDNVATGLHENVIFCRVDKNASSPSFDYVWNQTEDLKTKDGGTFTITSWNEGAYGNLSGYWDESDSTFATTVTDAAATSAPSTAAPTGTDPAETTAAPSTAATTAQNQTTDSNINRITVTSTQGLFEDVSENFAANNNFELTIKLKTSYPLSQGTVSMKFDPTQLTVYDRYTSPYTLPDDLVNVTDKGEFVLLFSSITTLVDTTNGGTFFTIRGKTNDAFTGDQKIEVNFDTLIGGRFVTEYDPVFQEYNTYVDKDFDYTYTEFSEVRNHELEVEAVLTNLSGAPATSPTQAPTQTDPTESATPAPTTVAPTTVAPTTAAPTTAAPTTVAPTGAAGTHKVTVKSPQGIFSDASAYVTPGEMFTIRIELKTEFPLSDATFAATYDPNQVLVGAYSTSLKMPTPTTNRLNGEYRFVLGTGAELVDTTNGGEFVTLKVKAQSAMDSDQIININFETLRSGRYNTVYDEWNEEYVQIVDPTFEQLYIAFDEVKNTDFDMKVYINWTGEQPTTAAPTTVAPTTVAPTTVAPTTAAPTTVAPTTLAPTTVAPTTVAPTTAAPTTAAPTTTAPTTVAPTTATPTSGDGSYKITVKSPQGIFTEASARIMPGEMFTIRIELKTEFPLSDATFAATYDPNQVLVGAYSTSLKMPTPTTNRLNGEYRFVLGTGAELVETTNGGEFVTLKAKALDTMNSDQIINLDFETLRSGRYNTVYDEWNQEYVQIVDPTFEQLYIAFDEVKNTDFDMKVYINWTGEQPTTAAPTTVAPTTVAPTTVAPTTLAPTTVAPTTLAPTTAAPTTVAPTTVAPTTVAPTTVAPTTVAPTTVAPTTLAPTTVAPTTVAPTTVAPTTVAPTTLAPTTVAPTTAAPTPSPDGKYQLTVRSPQNMFTPFSKRFEPGEEFAIGIKINTSRPIKGCNLTALFDQTQVSVDSYATTKQMTPFTSKYSGKYNFVVGSAGELIDPSGEFIMLRGKCLNEFNTNQEIILDFTYLIVGNLQDPDYEQYFVADGVMLSHDFSVRAYFTEYVEPQPTTAEPTTLAPTTAEPTTLAPTTAEPTTLAPTTAEPTTLAPTTAEPTTLAPTTAEPTTLAPTTAEPTTFKPTETVTEPTETATQTEPISTQPETETTTVTEATEATTAQPTEATTAGPVVPTDATEAPSTAEPTTQPTEATTAQPTEATTAGPVVPTDATEAPSTAEPTAQPTEATTAEPSTEATTAEPTTEAPTTQPETTTPATQAPTQAPTKAPATQPTTAKKIDNLDGNPNSDSAVDYVKNLKNDKDPKGSTFGLLRANSKKVTKNSIKVTWKKLKGAKKYIIMGNKCGKSYKKITTTTKLSFTQKKLRKGTYYKYMILAVNAKNKVIAVSKTLHVATKGGKVGNYKSVKITNAKSTLTLKKGRKMKLKAKAKKADKKVRNHRKIKFESSKPSVVKITAGGKLTAKKKGTAIIYAYAQNGVFKKIKVKVK